MTNYTRLFSIIFNDGESPAQRSKAYVYAGALYPKELCLHLMEEWNSGTLSTTETLSILKRVENTRAYNKMPKSKAIVELGDALLERQAREFARK